MVEESTPRIEALKAFVRAHGARHGIGDFSIEAASADASFRRYFRIRHLGGTHIVMDAPRELEDSRPFVAVAALMQEAGLRAPQVLAADLDHGFLLLTDLGHATLLESLKAGQGTFDSLFRPANDTLVIWQRATRPGVLPPWTEPTIIAEMRLFVDWFLLRHLAVPLDARAQQSLEAVFHTIAQRCLAQAQVFVHSDYMPRNLMTPVAPETRPGVLDFQDAVTGPIAYDIASLYRDAFVSWNEEQVLDGTIRYWDAARKAGLPVPAEFGDFYADVEWTGLQRHLRILGVFARLNERDAKPHYLADAPRFIHYVRHTARRYNALAPLIRLLDALHIGDTVESGVSF
jgi:hypothetical protein